MDSSDSIARETLISLSILAREEGSSSLRRISAADLSFSRPCATNSRTVWSKSAVIAPPSIQGIGTTLNIAMSAWTKLAEALGIETEANWDKLNRQKNMQRWGTQDRRQQDRMGPTPYFNDAGTGSAQRQATMQSQPPRMTPRPGGLQIPAGTDRPGAPRPNPLYGAPTTTVPRTQQRPGAPSMMGPDDDEDDGGL